jgi:hypothetical protein
MVSLSGIPVAAVGWFSLGPRHVSHARVSVVFLGCYTPFTSIYIGDMDVGEGCAKITAADSRSLARVRVVGESPVAAGDSPLCGAALGEQRNGKWRYLEFLQVTSLITAEIFMREIPGGMRAR